MRVFCVYNEKDQTYLERGQIRTEKSNLPARLANPLRFTPSIREAQLWDDYAPASMWCMMARMDVMHPEQAISRDRTHNIDVWELSPIGTPVDQVKPERKHEGNPELRAL